MGKKATKATRKYAASGQLKKEIQSRKKHQQVKRNIDRHHGSKGKGRPKATDGQREAIQKADKTQEDDDELSDEETGKFNGMNVDDFLNGGFMENDSEADASANADEDGLEGDEDDNESFASVDDLEEDEAGAHKLELEKLAEQDPEFYKYLQENDRELLEFGAEDDEDDEDVDDDAMDVAADEDHKAPTLSSDILRKWQKALLEHRSLRALRRMLIAFRAAAHMNEEEEVFAWTIDSPTVYEKLVTTALRYTPVVLDHHVPCKKLPGGKLKAPAQTPKMKGLQKLILSYFHNVIHLMDQLTADDMLILSINESAKLVPYITTSRKVVKAYLKQCLKLWSSAGDNVRVAAFLAIRRLASSSDEGVKDMVLKSSYLSLLRNTKTTNAHSLPTINLMKNTASELFCTDHASSYQHAFGYIRQLAVHLRNSMKVKSKDSLKQVYNWQFVHCIDFWAIVLARACSFLSEVESGQESELKALIYPLTQVALGAIKLVSASRSYPFHLHILRSLIHLSRHTLTFIPLTPYLVPIITSTLAPSSRPKASTLKPIDLEVHIRAPAQYTRTRVYNSAILEEAVFLLTEWAAAPHVQGSVAFPEVMVPVSATLKKSTKNAAGGKEAGVVKGLLERIEEGARWIEERRKSVTFAPRNTDQVRTWERDLNVEDMPLMKYLRSQRKLREKRRKLLEKAREGEEEYLEDSN